MGRKRINWELQPLGEVPDSVIAKALKADASTVCRARQRRGIKSCNPSGIRGIDWGQHPLGKVTDAEIAEKLKVTVKAVAHARRVRNIDPYVQSLYEKRTKAKVPAFRLTLEQQEEFKKYKL